MSIFLRFYFYAHGTCSTINTYINFFFMLYKIIQSMTGRLWKVLHRCDDHDERVLSTRIVWSSWCVHIKSNFIFVCPFVVFAVAHCSIALNG